MIEAEVWPRFARGFAWLCDRKLRGQFASAYARDLDRLLKPETEAPTLVVANHSAWWDGMVAVWLAHHHGIGKTHALMDAANLRHHSFFARCGAVGVDLDDPLDGARFLRWAARKLRKSNDTLWIFPQGRECPGNPRPLDFQAGAASLSRLLRKARILPVALDYLFVGNESPSLFISVGEPLTLEGDTDARNELMRVGVEAELDRIGQLVLGGQLSDARAAEAGFERLFGRAPRTGPDFATKALNALTKPREGEQEPPAALATAKRQA